MSKEFWNNRFSETEFVYGKLPNEYLRQKLSELFVIGEALFPAEGEGRNAVYAAALGWSTFAFDQSEVGRKKALALAEEHQTEISYSISQIDTIELPDNHYDLLVLIFSHLPEDQRRSAHIKLAKSLKVGGVLILEGFSKSHQKFQLQNEKAGGPRDIGMLYDLEELKKDFSHFNFKEAYQTETELSEGENHKGKSSVVRIFATKNTIEI